MVIFVTKTSCPRREITSLSLTVCAHIAATLYTPRFWPLIIGFCPFKPDTQPSVCPTLGLAGGGGDRKGDGDGSGGYAICLAGGGGVRRGDGDGSGGCVPCLAGGGGDGKGDGDGSGGYVICLAAGGGVGKGDGDGSGGLCLRPRRWWGQREVSCAGPQRCRGQSARKPARTLAHSLATP